MATDTYTILTNETADDLYLQFMDPDKQTDQWMLIKSPGPTITILALYLCIVLKVGPGFMKERGRYKLDLILRIYNIIQVLYNGYIVYLYLKTTSGKTVLGFVAELSCSLTDDYDGIKNLKDMYLYIGWHYILIKIIDLLDTVFMVLRKKMSQVTFLHVYHHACTVFFSWYTLKYIKAPQAGVMLVLNSFVHMVMYFYYFLATFDSLKKYLWWKRAVTNLQLIQFILVLLYLCTLYGNQCLVSRAFVCIWIFNVIVVMSLFINFYIKSYINKPLLKEGNSEKQKSQ